LLTNNFDNVLKLVLQEEGGFSRDPFDMGGTANLGVTQRIWEAYVGHEVNTAIMRSLTPADVAPLYRQNYWNRVHGDELPMGVDYAVMDFAVSSGTSRAAKTLQRVCGVEPNGSIGQETIQAVNRADLLTLIDAICNQRLEFLQTLPSFVTFGEGWSARVARVKAASEQMQQQSPKVSMGQGQS
jgi:lysozyme family protein